jgi:protein AATF/BFR2
VDGADLGMTQRFLERRRKLQDAGSVKVKKEVDRRASKHRKIRYVVHEKIVNFMTPMDNLSLFGGDESGKLSVLQTLFGMKTSQNATNNKRDLIEEDGIKLI